MGLPSLDQTSGHSNTAQSNTDLHPPPPKQVSESSTPGEWPARSLRVRVAVAKVAAWGEKKPHREVTVSSPDLAQMLQQLFGPQAQHTGQTAPPTDSCDSADGGGVGGQGNMKPDISPGGSDGGGSDSEGDGGGNGGRGKEKEQRVESSGEFRGCAAALMAFCCRLGVGVE